MREALTKVFADARPIPSHHTTATQPSSQLGWRNGLSGSFKILINTHPPGPSLTNGRCVYDAFCWPRSEQHLAESALASVRDTLTLTKRCDNNDNDNQHRLAFEQAWHPGNGGPGEPEEKKEKTEKKQKAELSFSGNEMNLNEPQLIKTKERRWRPAH